MSRAGDKRSCILICAICDIQTFNSPLVWNTSSATSMVGAFQNALAFNQDLSSWTFASVTDLRSTFRNAVSFNSPIPSDAGRCTTMREMFYGANSFNHSSIQALNTSSVTDFGAMFRGASNFNQPLPWNTSSATNLDEMFYSATKFSQNLSWDTSKVTTMQSTFQQASSFNGDISNWQTINVLSMSQMFLRASSFNCDISKWSTGKVSSFFRLFDNVAGSVAPPQPFNRSHAFNQDISSWDVGSCCDFRFMLAQNVLFNHDLNSWRAKIEHGSSACASRRYDEMFRGTACPIQESPDISGLFCQSTKAPSLAPSVRPSTSPSKAPFISPANLNVLVKACLWEVVVQANCTCAKSKTYFRQQVNKRCVRPYKASNLLTTARDAASFQTEFESAFRKHCQSR